MNEKKLSADFADFSLCISVSTLRNSVFRLFAKEINLNE